MTAVLVVLVLMLILGVAATLGVHKHRRRQGGIIGVGRKQPAPDELGPQQ